MRVLVCGGRDYGSTAFERFMLNAVLSCFYAQWKTDSDNSPFVIIHGAAHGADALAGAWAWKQDIAVIVEPADWDKHGRAAGPIRNIKMLDDHKPTQVVAFPGGTGTAHMIAAARKRGIPVFAIRYE